MFFDAMIAAECDTSLSLTLCLIETALGAS